MSASLAVDFECCGFVFEMPLVLRDDQTLLANAALGDQLIAIADAAHDEQADSRCVPIP